MKIFLLLFTLALNSLFAEVKMTQSLSPLTLKGDNGGYFSGKTWNSDMLKGKTTMLMYVDPDEKDKGEVFKSTIEDFEKDLDFNKFQILVILNLKATWIPNALIKKMMQSKMDTYPKRAYILDLSSTLVKQWGLEDDEYNTLVINDKGRVIYKHDGKWTADAMKKVDALVRSELQ